MNITKDLRNNLLSRREIELLVSAEKNPGFENSITMIAEKTKSDKENIVIKKVESRFGRNDFVIDAFVYDSVKDKQRIEQKAKKKEAKN